MGTNTVSTRRRFISIAGAALSAPVAAAAATRPSGVDRSDESVEARLARLGDLNAIRALNQAYARHVNAAAHEELAGLFADPSAAAIDRGIHAIAVGGFGQDEGIEVAADRRTATARVQCTLEMESEIGPSCPLVEMARQQGSAVICWTAPAVFESVYVRRDGVWKISRIAFAT